MTSAQQLLSLPPFCLEASAALVYNFIIPGWSRTIKMEEDLYLCVIVLEEAKHADAMYAIDVTARIYRREWPPRSEWILNTDILFVKTRVAVIELASPRPGYCEVTLNAERALRVGSRVGDMGPGLDDHIARVTVHRFLRLFWREYIVRAWEDYVAERASRSDAAIPHPQPLAEPQPLPTPQGRDLDQWFDHYYAMRSSGRKFTLKEIAERTDYSHGYIRNKKSEYDAEHGIRHT